MYGNYHMPSKYQHFMGLAASLLVFLHLNLNSLDSSGRRWAMANARSEIEQAKGSSPMYLTLNPKPLNPKLTFAAFPA